MNKRFRVNSVSVNKYIEWLACAPDKQSEWLSELLTYCSDKGNCSMSNYESLGVAFHNHLLGHLVWKPTKPFLRKADRSFYDKNSSKNHYDHLACYPLCAAIGVSLRTTMVRNARVSSYTFSIPAAKTFLKSAAKKSDLDKYGGQFFTELLDLYFAVFGRGNTLNEYFLDNILDQTDYKMLKVFCVSFNEEASNPLRWNHDKKKRIATLSVSQEVATCLSCDGGLGKEFWQKAWDVFYKIVILKISEDAPSDIKESVQKDWVSTAAKSLLEFHESLKNARIAAEERIWQAFKNGTSDGTIKCLKDIYPDEQLSLGQKLERLLVMLQGSLCLAPWRNDQNISLPVITIPAYANEYKSAWTVIPNDVLIAPDDWANCHHIVTDLFKTLHEEIEQFRNKEENQEALDARLRDDWKMTLKDLSGANSKLCDFLIDKRLLPLGPKFLKLVEAAQSLTGAKHEAHEVGYTFVYGPSELLKYVDRVVSNEVPVGDQDGGFTEQAGTEGEINGFSLRCEGHYSLFQQDRIASFVDMVRGSPLRTDKVILLKIPSDDNIAPMRNHALDDKYRAVRWLTWRVPWKKKATNVAAIVAGGDGLLRLFINGRLKLTWRKQSEFNKKHWQFGIEAGEEETVAVGTLRGRIAGALKKEQSCQEVRDLVATICEISDAPGEGAVFVIGGNPGGFPILCDMVPDKFKMQWASVRQLSGLEQQMLRSLAVMDGAVHIGIDTQKDAWVSARRYIAAAPNGRHARMNSKTGPSLTAQHIAEKFFIPWAKHLKECTPNKGNEGMLKVRADRLYAWADEIGIKGTRHRSVIQLCLWLLNQPKNYKKPLVCSISADGPVNLYEICDCECKKELYLWIERVIG